LDWLEFRESTNDIPIVSVARYGFDDTASLKALPDRPPLTSKSKGIKNYKRLILAIRQEGEKQASSKY